jgi:hypothetical protein
MATILCTAWAPSTNGMLWQAICATVCTLPLYVPNAGLPKDTRLRDILGDDPGEGDIIGVDIMVLYSSKKIHARISASWWRKGKLQIFQYQQRGL